tara:strand:+ start:728 stop:907 length:180 start_codon:yes stop_codon:yes gene_type:complete
MGGMSDSVLVAVVTGGVSAGTTIAAMRVHVQNLRERIDRMQQWIAKLEERLEHTRDQIR